MKTKLHLQSLAAIFFLTVSLGAAPAQKGPDSPPAIDPITGLPLSQPTPWKDPDIVLTNVSYETPLGEVTRDLRERFKSSFDVLVPVNGDINWQSTMIRLQLKNVTASEVFNAMNLVFENDKTPLRWELKLNGNRPIVLLRVLVEPNPKNAPSLIDPTTGLPVPPPPEPMRMVYFVGDLLGDGTSGGMNMEQLTATVSDVYRMSYNTSREEAQGHVQFHDGAQLLIVNGTPDQIDFFQQTLRAMRLKAEADRSRQKPAEAKPKADEPKSISPPVKK